MAYRGSSAIEYIFIVAIALTALVAIATISINTGNDSIRVAQAKDSVAKLAQSADYVSSLGPGSRETISVLLPSGMSLLQTSGNVVHMRISLSSGESDVYSKSESTLIGDVNMVPGLQTVTITSLPDGSVLFGNPLIVCSPQSVFTSVPNNYNGGTEPVVISDLASYPISALTAYLSTSGSINLTGNGYIRIANSQPLPSAITNNTTATLNINFNTSSQASGVYIGTLNVNGSNGSRCITQIYINVVNNDNSSSGQNIVVAVDLGAASLSAEKSGASGLVGLVSNATQLGVVLFDGSGNIANTSLMMMSSANKTYMENFINTGSGGSDIDGAITSASNMLQPLAGQKAIILFTDSTVSSPGNGNAGKIYCADGSPGCHPDDTNVNTIRDANNITLYIVDYGSSDDEAMTTYALSTGGQYYYGFNTDMLQVYQDLWN
jgi:hypothetical protein